MYLTGIAAAAPSPSFTQAECWAALQNAPQFAQLNARSHAVLKKVLSGGNGIVTRHLAVDNLAEAFVLTPDALHARFARHAPALATQSAERALAAARLTSAQVDAVLISTCTGCLCPGLTRKASFGAGFSCHGALLKVD